MAEPKHPAVYDAPDFDQIAFNIVIDAQLTGMEVFAKAREVAAQLKQVWNARGEADKHAIDVEAHRVHAEATRTGRTDIVMDLAKVLNDLDR